MLMTKEFPRILLIVGVASYTASAVRVQTDKFDHFQSAMDSRPSSEVGNQIVLPSYLSLGLSFLADAARRSARALCPSRRGASASEEEIAYPLSQNELILKQLLDSHDAREHERNESHGCGMDNLGEWAAGLEELARIEKRRAEMYDIELGMNPSRSTISYEGGSEPNSHGAAANRCESPNATATLQSSPGTSLRNKFEEFYEYSGQPGLDHHAQEQHDQTRSPDDSDERGAFNYPQYHWNNMPSNEGLTGSSLTGLEDEGSIRQQRILAKIMRMKEQNHLRRHGQEQIKGEKSHDQRGSESSPSPNPSCDDSESSPSPNPSCDDEEVQRRESVEEQSNHSSSRSESPCRINLDKCTSESSNESSPSPNPSCVDSDDEDGNSDEGPESMQDLGSRQVVVGHRTGSAPLMDNPSSVDMVASMKEKSHSTI